jgi:anaerobic magnesium-protoporphyrin IX monomethyl ester cyclase
MKTKVIFVNPPFYRSENSNASNNFKVDGPRFHKIYRNIPQLLKIWNKFRDPAVRFGVRAGSRWPWTWDQPLEPIHYPFMMAYATSYLISKGIESKLIDSIAEEDYSYSNFLKKIKKEKADIVVMETSMISLDIDMWLAKKISSFSEVGIAGSYVTYYAQSMRNKYPFISYLLPGEYIKSSFKMAVKKQKGVYKSEIISDLDALPFPYRDYPESIKYYDPTMPTPKPQLQIYGSKGCPFKCSFCLWTQTMYFHKFALRDPKRIAEEIKHCVKKYKFKSIFFDDDTFNIGNERISELCDLLKEINLPWTMMGRLDCSPDWLIDKMVACGCVGMRFGLETFNKKVSKRVDKGLVDQNLYKKIKRLSDRYPKLMLRIFMMKDLPGQTNQMHQSDMKKLQGLGFKEFGDKYRQIQVSVCAPFPGTKLFEEIKDKVDSDKLDDYRLYDGHLNTIMKYFNKNNSN